MEIDPAVWERPAMRAALRARDIGAVYRLLQRAGVAQRQIAALTGQAQSDVSEILSGRNVKSYDLLARIATGLGAPRGYLGLAYQENAAPPTPAPSRLHPEHVTQLATVTDLLRGVDAQAGGGACRDAALAQVRRGARLLDACGAPTDRRRLRLALADLHLVTGWTTFDVGLPDAARRHFRHARALAGDTGAASLVAKTEYCLGRLRLHHGQPDQAARHFQRGLATARRSGCRRTAALLAANHGWALAEQGDAAGALAAFQAAERDWAAAGPDSAPWIRGYGEADLHALTGVGLAALAQRGPRHLGPAIRALTAALALRPAEAIRSRAFELATLATVRLHAGEPELGVATGRRAVELAEALQSRRVVDRLTPLSAALTSRRDAVADAERAGLLRRIRLLQHRRDR